MEDRIFLFLTIISSTLTSVSSVNECLLENRTSGCVYTVICDTYAGRAYSPDCNYEPNVKFVIKGSNAQNLTSAFFGATNFDSRVREIKAYNNNWSIISDGSFRYYQKTLVLDLADNNINIISNAAFLNLLFVEKINLSRNHIYELYANSFFASDGKESKIIDLDLSYNNIKNLTIGPFNLLNNLKILHLEYNEIKILSQDTFKNNNNLTELYLQNNMLSNLSASLINLKLLNYLDLSYNSLSEISGIDLNRLTSLVRINMSNNIIESLESNCFNQAFNLEVIDLRNNKLKSIIESIMFINNVKLRYLDLEKNCITKIQDDAFKHNALEYINLEKNNITGEINNKTFIGLQKLRNLTISNQTVSVIRDGTFSNMNTLYMLNISHNFITVVENSSFGILSNLNILDLSFNNISNIHFLSNSVKNLTVLNLNNNLLSVIHTHAFINQTQLIKLDVSMNKIKVIEQNSLPLRNLQILNITSNPLTGVIEANTLSPAQYLRYLDLSNLNISKIGDRAFVNLPVLARMNLSGNAIADIATNNFIDTNNIYSLDISHNKLKKIELNSRLEKLKALYINNNILEILPDLNMSSVIYLDLSSNKLCNISETSFKSMTGLRVLRISQNRLKSFNNNFTNRLVDLTDLNLSDNEISNINLSYFKELINLDMSNNKLNKIDNSFLQDMDPLQFLDISKNNISELLPGTFQNIKILKFLNISFNSLKSLRYGSLKGLHKTEVIDISKNKIHALDVDIFHECLELKKLILDFNYIKVLDIERLLNVAPKLSSVSIGGNPLSCKEIVRNIGKINMTLAFHAVEITSTDKIYHEDNVYGIKCGDNNSSANGQLDSKSGVIETSEHSFFSILIIVLLVIILFFIIFSVIYLYLKHSSSSRLHTNESRLQIRSLELGSDYQSDLISYN